jgi:ABC-type glycerol-3-phosphate transport system substrate-binding protein
VTSTNQGTRQRRAPRAWRWAAAGCATALALGVAACGGGGSGGSGSGPVDAKPAKLTGSITVWDQRYASSPDWKRVMAKADQGFEAAHPGVKINHVGQTTDPNTYSAQIRAAIQAHKGPDALLITPGYNGLLRYTSAMEPLDKTVGEPLGSDLNGWYLARAKYAATGTAYGVPYGLQSYVIFYNKKLFKQAGLDPENPPRTFTDLLAAAKKLKAAGITPFSGGNKEGYINGWMLSMMAAGTLTPEQTTAIANGDMPADSPGVEQAITDWKELAQGSFDKSFQSTTFNNDQHLAMFNKGKSAMVPWLGCCAVNVTKKLGQDAVGVITGFGVSGPTPNFLSGGPDYSWAVPKFAKNKALAVAYIKYLASPAVEGPLYEDGGFLPNNKTVPAGTGGPVGPLNVAMVNSYAKGQLYMGLHALWPLNVELVYEREMNLVIDGDESVKSLLGKLVTAQKQTNNG